MYSNRHPRGWGGRMAYTNAVIDISHYDSQNVLAAKWAAGSLA
jgi:hypothetical protein